MTTATAENPVFVYGALRSGTTVFRLMLDSHIAVFNPGEVDPIFDHLHRDASGVWRYDLTALRENRVFQNRGLTIPEGLDGTALLDNFLDQLRGRGQGVFTLNIHRGIGRAMELLPNARVIHMLRDPRDVARSSIGMGWAANTYHGVDHWIGTERDWDAAAGRIPPESVLDLRYEALLNDLEGQLRRVCDFLGIAFAPGMLDYHLSSSYGPPDPKLVEQWRRKAAPHELSLLEGKIGDLLEGRGYVPSGHSPALPGTFERLRLSLGDRLGRWRAAAKRFGLWTMVMEKLTRRLGLKDANRVYRKRMNATIAKTLK